MEENFRGEFGKTGGQLERMVQVSVSILGCSRTWGAFQGRLTFVASAYVATGGILSDPTGVGSSADIGKLTDLLFSENADVTEAGATC